MKKSSSILDMVSGAIFSGVSIASIYHINKNDVEIPGSHYGPGFFPTLVAYLFLIFAVIMTFKSAYFYFRSERVRKSDDSARTEKAPLLYKMAALFIILFVYAYAFNGLGFFISTIPLLFFTQLLYGGKNIVATIGTALVLPIVLFFIFDKLFKIPLTTIFS